MPKKRTSEAPLPTPSDETQCIVGTRPANDDGYFEQMTKAVFCSGFNWNVIDAKWPGFRKAFANFSIQKVALFDEPDIDLLMQDKGIVRNHRKVRATIENARELLTVQQEHGSLRKYLKTISRDGEEALLKALSKRFGHLGRSTAFFFLRAVGEELPDMEREMTRRWEER